MRDLILFIALLALIMVFTNPEPYDIAKDNYAERGGTGVYEKYLPDAMNPEPGLALGSSIPPEEEDDRSFHDIAQELIEYGRIEDKTFYTKYTATAGGRGTAIIMKFIGAFDRLFLYDIEVRQ